MNERKAKDLRNFLRSNMVAREGGYPGNVVGRILSGFTEKQVRRAMQVIGEPTTGVDILSSVQYGINVTAGMKRKRIETAYSLALSQLRGVAKIPKQLRRIDPEGNVITGRSRLLELVKEGVNATI